MSAATTNGGDTASKQQLKSDSRMQQPPPPPKNAWGKSLNPKTSNTNGTDKPTHSTPKQLPKSSGDVHKEQAHDRSLFLLAHFVGKVAIITVKNGEQYSGVMSGASLESPKPQYILKMTRRLQSGGPPQTNGASDQAGEYVGEGDDHAMGFDIQDTADLFVSNVTTAAAPSQQNGSAGSFLTDTQISNKEAHAGRARELQRWEAGAESSAADMSLGDPNDRSWDQFAANERLYGVQTTYDENMYTTAIDRNTPEFRRKQAEADRIAREIEGSAPANAHIAEERRRDASRDDGGDEEDKYSGVRRESALPKRAQGAYVPPSQRPITGAPSVSGAPFDPAIISSQLRATPSASTQTPPSGSSPAPKVAVEPETAPPKRKEGTTEDRVRDTADAFKLFANNEKLRIKAAQEAKRNTVRQEKNVKLNDLKKFAANFKLKSRVPDDLVPILAKDREKQLEIQSKAEEAAREEELRSRDTDRTTSNAASPVPSTQTSHAGSSTPDSRQQFNQSRAARSSHSGRGGVGGPAPLHPGQMPPHAQVPSPRQPLSQRIGANNNLARQGMPPDIRVPPSGPSGAPSEPMMSPQSATRLNVNAKAFEFRPVASAFTPTGTSPSPQRAISRAPAEATSVFFDKNKPKTAKPFPADYDPLKRVAEAEYTASEKKKYASNGGMPQAYNTIPTWQTPKSNEGVSYLQAYPTAQSLAANPGPSPMQTPIVNPQMSHAHQLPAHMHAQGMQGPPHRQQPFFPPQPGHFDPRLQQQHFGPNGSVQNSPRAQHMPVAPFNNQMPPMPQHFPGQPMPPGYGMSPSMQYRQPHMQGPMMMMPGQPQGQMPMRPGNYGPGPQFNGPQMGGHMMVQQQSGGYANGPMPQNFSPMPPHAQPHMPHNMQQHGNQGFQGSPRPPMMSHQGSHQGFQPGMPMQPHFQPSPGQHPYHLQQQQRAMSGSFQQMTPRQQAAVPNHPSPGMGGAPVQGDEGK
uniref:LsmAD domain-containing protein n=1 Tax=Ramularia collo-cygni TaxID=112498 RepID=A0A2D3VJU2_9PEZI